MSKHFKYDSERSKISKTKVLSIILIIVAIIAAILYSSNKANKTKNAKSFDNNNLIIEKNETSNEIVVPEDKVATIVSIGDTLVHSQNFKDAYDSSTDTYDFSSFFKDVSHYFEGRTVGVCNLETTMAGADRGYSGYPTFNSPDHLATDLKELGIDIATTANNHALDMGYSGLVHHLGVVDAAGIQHTGSARSIEEQGKILFKDLNGIKTAFLAYTYGTNGIPLPTGKEYCVNRIDKNFMKSQIDQAKAEGAELICVSIHWGDEYKIKENSEQDDLAEFLIENDVKVILGCHPHVLEPMQMKTVNMSDGTTKTGYVMYSMGNFFSAQTFPNTRDSVILNIQIRKNGQTNQVSVDKVTYAPTYCYDNGTSAKDRYEILDLNAIVADHDSGKNKWSTSMYNLATEEIERIKNIVGPEINNQVSNNENNNNSITENNVVAQ